MKHARQILRWSVTVIFALALLPVINLNVEKLAEKKGWDSILSERWDWVISVMSSIAESPVFLVILGVALGGTVFLWIDYFLRRRERPAALGQTNRPDAHLNEVVRYIKNGTVWGKQARDEYFVLTELRYAAWHGYITTWGKVWQGRDMGSDYFSMPNKIETDYWDHMIIFRCNSQPEEEITSHESSSKASLNDNVKIYHELDFNWNGIKKRIS